MSLGIEIIQQAHSPTLVIDEHTATRLRSLVKENKNQWHSKRNLDKSEKGNITILDIANLTKEYIPTEIIVAQFKDASSYRINSKKLLPTTFKPKMTIMYTVQEVIESYLSGLLRYGNHSYNLKRMQTTEIVGA